MPMPISEPIPTAIAIATAPTIPMSLFMSMFVSMSFHWALNWIPASVGALSLPFLPTSGYCCYCCCCCCCGCGVAVAVAVGGATAASVNDPKAICILKTSFYFVVFFSFFFVFFVEITLLSFVRRQSEAIRGVHNQNWSDAVVTPLAAHPPLALTVPQRIFFFCLSRVGKSWSVSCRLDQHIL